MVIFCVCGHVLDRGLWSRPGCVCGHLLGLWSCPGCVSGDFLGLWSFPGSWSVFMSWVGLWSPLGSVVISYLVVCGHLWGLWSFLGLWSYSGSSCLLELHVFWVFMSSGFSCLLGHLLCLHLHVLGGSVVIFWVCGHYLDRGLWSCLGGFCSHVRSVVIFWVCDHFLDRGLW